LQEYSSRDIINPFSSIFPPYLSAAMPVSRGPMAIEDKKQAVLMAEAFQLKRVALLGSTFENQIENSKFWN
jgi:hypothetical protein